MEEITPPPIDAFKQTPNKTGKGHGIIWGMSIAFGFLLVLFCVFTLFALKHASHKKQVRSALNNTMPEASCRCTLLFANFTGAKPDSPVEYSVTDEKGNLIKRLTARDTDSFFSTYDTNANNYISYAKGILASDAIDTGDGKPVTTTKYAIIEADGTILNASSGSLDTFNRLSEGGNYNTFVGSDNMIYATDPSQNGPLSPFTYMQLDPVAGIEKTIFTLAPANSTYLPLFAPENISATGDTISFLLSDVRINDQLVNGTAIGVYNLVTKKLTIKQLPATLTTLAQATNPHTPLGANGTIGVSSDGNLIVYQTFAVQNVNGIRTYVATTHLYNLALQKDITFPPNTSGGLAGVGFFTSFFSPDNTYIVLQGEGFAIARVSDGAVVQQITYRDADTGTSSQYEMNVVGWLTNNTFAYNTEYSTVPNDFLIPGTAVAYGHAVNITTHKVIDYPKRFGMLVAVIYK